MHHDLDQRSPLARLLHGLPEDALPPYDFREFERRAAQRRRAAPERRGGPVVAAAAVLAVTALAVLLRFSAPPPRVARGAVTLGDVRAVQAIPALMPERPEVLEHWLASLPSDPALVRVGTRAAVSGLEDRIAQLDDQLSAARLEPAQARRLDALQQERTQLMGALVRVRYAESLADAAR
jgi:hypothetical protein